MGATPLDAHEGFFKLAIKIVFAIHIPPLKVLFQVRGKAVHGRSLVNSLEIQWRYFTLKALDRHLDCLFDLLFGHDG